MVVFASKPGDSSKSRKSAGEQASDVSGMLIRKINRLRKTIQAERVTTVREKVENNRKKLESHISQLVSSRVTETDISLMESGSAGNMLEARMKKPLCIVSGHSLGSGDKDDSNNEDVDIPVCAKLPPVDKIPPYTTWSFLSRNQRMADDQSVVGRRQIYYDSEQGSEALICTDSEDEIGEPEEEKHEFTEAEDRILRMVVEEFDPGEEVLNILTQYIGGSTTEIQEHCNMLRKTNAEKCDEDVKKSGEVANDKGIDLGKSLAASLDSLDNLFCRRCLVFDCRLHGYSQSLNRPSERHSYTPDPEEVKNPCGVHCYLQNAEGTVGGAFSGTERTASEEEKEPEVSVNTGKRKISKQTSSMPEGSTLVSDHLQGAYKKHKILSTAVTVATAIEVNQDDEHSHDRTADLEVNSSHEVQLAMTSPTAKSLQKSLQTLSLVEGQAEGIQNSCQWKPLEKELYLKGVEIFGRNSCFIARNLLSGLKTCVEVFKYMNDGCSALSHSSLLENKEGGLDHEDGEVPSRSRLLRKRGKTRKLKYSRKSAGHPGTWRRIADGKDEPCRQYTPCGCESQCGKNCPCVESKTCCEKYCGCAKSCKNRFRGCHCAKSQCRSRQCPCFAANRECDPDVCRNCWVSCGDGTLGEPPRRGDGQCGNMRLLLRQQQRILLGKSDVAGWGAFLKNPVDKNDYLGEYTGELISHKEADKRGKIYDLTNSSFLFDLNDHSVLDAYRKGDKLKFANHSKNPNCYAKVMLVAGDHRVGIFAKKPIEAGEEIFYDYHYKPDSRPVWARKLEGMKGDDSTIPQGRAKKHQSQK